MKNFLVGQKILQVFVHSMNCQKMLKIMYNRIVELTGIPLMTFSVGPAREQTNVVNDIWE